MSNPSFSFSVFGNRYFFTPKFTLATLFILLLLIGLGIWERHSVADLSTTVNLINQRIGLDPLHISDIDKQGDWRFHPIQIEGTFDDDHQILISDSIYKGQRGYLVLTPFKPSDSFNEILINRGWIPEFPEGKMPNLSLTSKSVTIFGVLFHPPQTTFGSGFNDKKITWPLIIKKADITKIAKAIDSPLYPYLVLLSPNSQYGFVREWLLLTTTLTEPDRHLAYAKQWFVLALTVLLAFIFLNIHRVD